MRLRVYRFSRGKVQGWPCSLPIFLQVNFTVPALIMSVPLARYQELFSPFVLKKQKAALRFADTFAPKSNLRYSSEIES